MEKWIDKYWQGRASSAESDITDAFIKACFPDFSYEPQ